MLSYIMLEKLSDEYQRERLAEAEAERRWRASQRQPENRQARRAAAGLPSFWLRANGWGAARLIVRALSRSAPEGGA